jgi:putative tryptophan/tyrosine transport system substrate-binding protein
MRRRDFVALIGGAAVACPAAAHGQQPENVRRVGYLTGGMAGPEDTLAAAQTRALADGLRERGWVEGRNLTIDYRFGAGRLDRIRANASELIGLHPDAIVCTGGPALRALLDATRTIPIVFTTISDPVGAGYVTSLAHPGGNVTGFAVSESEIAGKWLELLKEIAPQVTRAMVILYADAAPQLLLYDAVAAAAPALGLTLVTAAIHDYAEAERAVEAFAREPGGGLIVFSNIVMAVPPERGPQVAARFRRAAD